MALEGLSAGFGERLSRKMLTTLLLISMIALLLIAIVTIIIIAVLAQKTDTDTCPAQTTTEVTWREFGTTTDGEVVFAYTMRNGNGVEVEILTLGGTIRTLKIPDRDGNIADVVSGFSDISGYLGENPYFGSLIGRYANRIANGTFTLDGVLHHVTKNTYRDPPMNHLHGGTIGWDKYVWAASVEDGKLVLKLESEDGDQGYPGNVNAVAIFELTEDNQLILKMTATTDKATPINLTTHSYFNLAGHDSGTIYDQELTVFADQYLVVDEARIPTGEVANVSNTLFDLNRPTRLGDRIRTATDTVGGPLYDHNFCIRGTTGKKAVARLYDPGSGRILELYTNQPGAQVYTATFNDVRNTSSTKDGANYLQHSGIAIEPQNYPDAPNHATFPDSILRPGNVYEHTIWHHFSTDAD